ncbi:hypothetical protein CTI12_AA150780 [Artemisia annua]|uniref:Uncharacterized protein n=1 Tax=Artemisia annua TaxID=35608 RepID=A0A2U1PHY3_ARTAN|nr:hypothetical protein CTI12_AA150780 [Artemisia annua]
MSSSKKKGNFFFDCNRECISVSHIICFSNHVQKSLLFQVTTLNLILIQGHGHRRIIFPKSSRQDKPHIIYPRHDPTQDWDKMEPVLGMRFESNEQLKLALANYGVYNGYQLWFERNDWKQLLVYCGLERAVSEFLPNAEHRKCTRHLFANFKRKFSGVELQRLFWQATSTSVQDNFYSKMEEMRVVNQEAYNYLLQRNPNSWSRAFFSLDSKCPNFENDICESFNRAILVQRIKPIITMLEDITLYVMQRLVAMNRTARLCEDNIKPSIRKILDKMIQFQLNSMWKRTRDPPLLPPLMRTMPGRPRKKKIIAPDENNSQVTRRGRIMTCSNCQERGHNKSSCKKEPVPKPPKPTRASNNTTNPDFTTYASARGGGRGSRGRRGARGCGRGARGVGRVSRGGGRGQQRTMFMDEDEIRNNMHHDYMEELLIQEEDRLAALDRARLEQEAFDEEAVSLNSDEEERWKEQDLKREQDEHAEHVEWEKNMGLHPSCYMSEDESFDQEPYNREQVSVNDQIETQESIYVGIRDAPPADDALLIPEVVDAPCDLNDDAATKGKAVAVPEPNKKFRKRQAHDDPLRIYHKNRGRSERIFGQKMKKTGLGENGEGSTPDTAFSVDEP